MQYHRASKSQYQYDKLVLLALRTPSQHAEEIKIKYACALAQLASEGETIKVPSVGDRPPRNLSRQALAEVVEPRYDELFTLVQAELRRSGFEDLAAAGLVMTGGTSKMEGAIELAEEIFHMPVRLAKPVGVRGMEDIMHNPIYATGMGLLVYARQNLDRTSAAIQDEPPMIAEHREDTEEGLVKRMKSWFQSNF